MNTEEMTTTDVNTTPSLFPEDISALHTLSECVRAANRCAAKGDFEGTLSALWGAAALGGNTYTTLLNAWEAQDPEAVRQFVLAGGPSMLSVPSVVGLKER
jgi:hypothetical protein